MRHNASRGAIVLAVLTFLVPSVFAQSLGGPGLGGPTIDDFSSHRDGTAPFDISESGLTQLNSRMMFTDPEHQMSPLQNPALMVSQLDLKAPKEAKKEFEKGYQYYSRKDYQSAIEHLAKALAAYPDYVAAHNALGSAYLGLDRNNEAREQFAKAAVLDPRLPLAFLNLAYAETALHHYSAAQVAAQKASAIAPLDLQVLTLLAFSQLMNKDYAASAGTADKAHDTKEPGHAIVHFYAAAAWDHQNDVDRATAELKKLIAEDPKSDAAAKARDLMQQLKTEKRPDDSPSASVKPVSADDTNPAEKAFKAQIALQATQDGKEQQQVTEAEAMCESCEIAAVTAGSEGPGAIKPGERGWTLHSNVDEVSVLFVATDRGKPIRDLIQSEVSVRDAGKPPASVVAFRTESELPLRLGLIIDTSESVRTRFSFEQSAASDFAQKVLTKKDDTAFVVGASNSVLLVQDFTSDTAQITDGIRSLAPAGGTALWDAVEFAANKLSETTESQPVAKVLVVISDGRDNSSRNSLKHAIEASEHQDVTIYTVSTSDVRYLSTAFLDSAILGDRALKNLAERTGGTSFAPGSINNLDKSLSDLQEFIRGRYALLYKPALLKHDDQYRAINITAQKSGRKLRVYSRKGYYARASFASNPTP
ncbi:MAG TPA: VWA domain-containing protein [Terriglobales bacterium]